MPPTPTLLASPTRAVPAGRTARLTTAWGATACGATARSSTTLRAGAAAGGRAAAAVARRVRFLARTHLVTLAFRCRNEKRTRVVRRTERPSSKLCPATSYSPTQWPAQYHRR